MKKYKKIILGILLVISCLVSYQIGSISSSRNDEVMQVTKLSYGSNYQNLI